jgi:hypothetical protein
VPIGDVAVDDEDAVEDDTMDDAVEDEDAINWWPRAAAITAMTSSVPAARILRIRIRRGVARARSLSATPPVKAARRCQHVCGFRYADDRRRL